MKVSIITMQFPSHSETFASNDIRIMKEQGMDVNVFGMKSKHKDYQQLKNERDLNDISIDNNNILKNLIGILVSIIHPMLLIQLLKFILFKNQRNLSNYLKLLLLVPSSFYIFYKLKEESPNIVHLFWGHFPSLVGLLIKQSNLNIKVTMFLGAYDLEHNLGVSENLVKKCDKIFTHSKGNKKILLKRYNLNDNDIVVFYRGVDLDKFQFDNNIIKEKDSFLTIGTLNAVKGHRDVILAFSKIVEQVPLATLKIIGRGPDEYKLKKLVKDLKLTESIIFLGHISHDKVFKYLEKSEYFLYMSVYTGDRLPNALKEAMLAKNICIVTKTQDIEELIIDKKDGFLVDYHDINGAINIFTNLINNEEKKQFIKTNASSKIISTFNIKVSIKKIINEWSKISE